MHPALEPAQADEPRKAPDQTGVLRVAYAIEFLMALTAVFVAWGQVGGQSHLDIMPWYWKLGLGGGLAICAVKLTQAAAAAYPRGWTRGTAAWSVLTALALLTMGVVTYYYHLHENDEELMEEGVRIEKTLFHSQLGQRSNHP